MKTENEIIAEFMGLQVYQSYSDMQAVPIGDLKEWALPEQLQYDKEWNWIMPAFQKFRMLTINDEDNQDIHRDHCDHITRTLGMVDIKEVHNLLAWGIKWYNLINK